MIATTTIYTSLCAIFNGNVVETAAKAMAIAAIKNTMLEQPIKTMAKELSKLIPGLGSIVAPTIPVALFEAAGWALAKELEQKFS